MPLHMVDLPAPFQGNLFEQMYSDAVEVIAGHLSAAQLVHDQQSLKSLVGAVLDVYLYGTATGDIGIYRSQDAANVRGGVVLYVSSRVQVEPMVVETILAEIELDTAMGEIAAWFVDPQQAVQSTKAAHSQAEALKPSFLQRVAANILQPFGLDPSTAKNILVVGGVLVGGVLVISLVNAVRPRR